MIRGARHTNFIFLLLVSLINCTNHVEIDAVDCEINKPGIHLETKSDPQSCDTNDGTISVSGSGGKAPYQFRINGGTYQSSGMFNQLNGGSFIVEIKDANDCVRDTTVSLSIISSDLKATVTTEQDNECLTDNGSITVSATGSSKPFQYKIGNGSFGTDTVFSGLKHGLYNVTVKDAQGCSISISATINRGETGISWSNEVKSIIDTNCAISGCHVSGSQSPNLSSFSTLKNNANAIKSRVVSRAMPPDGRSITQEQIDKIACWVDDGAKQN
ncbi:MAG TPA: hypothetical protein VIM65_19665 [Cyclobacteriaceae bacterium]